MTSATGSPTIHKTKSSRASRTVLVVGPPLNLIGGMATVTGQMLELNAHGGGNALSNDPMHQNGCFRFVHFPTTFATDTNEPFTRRILRHAGQAGALDLAIDRTGASIVHLHTCSGFSFFRSVMDLLTASRRGCRTVLHVHGAGFDEFHRQSSAVPRKFIAWGLGSADAVIALSRTWCDRLCSIAPGASIAVVENAVDMPRAVPVRERAGACRFLFLARLDHWKGVDDLLAASAMLRQRCAFELTLAGPPGTAGDGPVIAEKVAEAGLDACVRYVGAVHGEEKSEWLRWADVFVQPSHQEGMPLSMLEAMSFGLPVVATDVGAVAEVLGDGNAGLLLPPHEPAGLAQAMEHLAQDQPRRVQMGAAGRAIISQRFTLNMFSRNLTAVYEQCCGVPDGAAHSLTSDPVAELMCSARSATLR